MLDEVIAGLNPRSGGDYLDGTVGSAGHAEAILEHSSPAGRLLALDRDPGAVARSAERLVRFGDRALVRHASFDSLDDEAASAGFDRFDGVLLDLGFSSDQLDDASRGFSFQAAGPLDMRLDPTQDTTAADLVNELPEEDLANLIFRMGEEPRSRRIARAICRARPIEDTGTLASLVAAASGYRGGRTHPATRTFQALRLGVNDELATLERGLPLAVDRLAPRGRIAVISFHSLEDRIVKLAFRRMSTACVCPPGLPQCLCGNEVVLVVLTKKPMTPSTEEVLANPRARSAKLRLAERIPEEVAA